MIRATFTGDHWQSHGVGHDFDQLEHGHAVCVWHASSLQRQSACFTELGHWNM